MSTAQFSPTRVLIAYGSSEGQTAKIAEYLADMIRGDGCVAYPVDLKRSGAPRIEDYDAVIVGASVHMGKHQKYVRHFVKQNLEALKRLPSAFFSVNLAAQEQNQAARKEVVGYLAEFAKETGWRPRKVAVFAGALLYTQYGLITRWIMRRIARSKGSPDLDTSRDYAYTDWEGVNRFADEFLGNLGSYKAA
jgi:menaquinone-dependent protoporphyrinogen oxidase